MQEGSGGGGTGGASMPKKEDPVVTGGILILYPVLQRCRLERETFSATMRVVERMLPVEGKHPQSAKIRERCGKWGAAFLLLEGQGDLENLDDKLPFMHAGLYSALCVTISMMSRLVPYSRVGLALLASEYYGGLQKAALSSIVLPKKAGDEDSAGEAGQLPAPFTASLVRYLLSIVPAMLPGRDLLRLLMSVNRRGLFDMGVLLDGECLRSASDESVEAVPNPLASDRLSDMLRRLAQDDPAKLYRVSWLTEDPVLHKPLWAWVSVLRGEEGTSVTAIPTEAGEVQSPTPTQQQQKTKEAEKPEEQQEQQCERSGESGVEEQRPQAGSEAGGGAEPSKVRLQIRFSATEESVEVEDGGSLVDSLELWFESLALVSTYLVAFWAAKCPNVLEKAGYPSTTALTLAAAQREASRPEATTIKRWGYVGIQAAAKTSELLQSVTTEGRMLVLHVGHMDHAESDRQWRDKQWKCEICQEDGDDDEHLDMSLRPCGHHACRTCCQGIAAGRQQFACPFCRTTVVAEPLRDLINSPICQKMTQGGQITQVGAATFMPACEMAVLANKASDVKERPSTPIELVKVVLHERGGTIGTATGFVEDGLRLVPLLLQKGPGAIFLFTSHSQDGRHECASVNCKKLEPGDGSKKWATCGQCHVARYCSRECQRTAWEKWGHRRICNMYKQRFLDQTAADTTPPPPQKEDKVSRKKEDEMKAQEEPRAVAGDEKEQKKKQSKKKEQRKKQGQPFELAIDLDD